jgi:hypothetical protein
MTSKDDRRWKQEDKAVLQKWSQDSGGEKCHKHEKRNIRKKRDQEFEEIRRSRPNFWNCFTTYSSI